MMKQCKHWKYPRNAALDKQHGRRTFNTIALLDPRSPYYAILHRIGHVLQFSGQTT